MIGNMNTAARELFVELEARESDWNIGNGVRLRGLSYNGQIPGPVIEARVGDTLVVRLTNNMDEETTIHWHGLRVPAVMDGTEIVQRPVAPGETYEYRFEVPDAGTFWFHPHTNETAQVERGLHGMLIVRPREPETLVVDRERVMVLDDVLLDDNNDFASFDAQSMSVHGRDGNVLLLNGRSDRELSMAGGQVERWRIANVANSRYMNLSLGGREFRLVGTDCGLIERPVTVRELLLVPGDRVEILVGPFAAGETFAFQSLPVGHEMTQLRSREFARVRVGEAKHSVAHVPGTFGGIEPLAPFNAVPTRAVRFEERRGDPRSGQQHGGHHQHHGAHHHQQPGAHPEPENHGGGHNHHAAGGDLTFLVNGEIHLDDSPVAVGELQIWEIINDTHMDHPFHLHGFFFQLLRVNDAPPSFLSWEDTCNVPARGRITIAWLPDDRPGKWMYHCHILEHHAMGMMAHFEVVRGQRSHSGATTSC